MKMIVGLGNPGTKYAQTKHNIGFMVVDRMAEKQQAVFKKIHLKRKLQSFSIKEKKSY